ncbi:hypothetical protein CVT24_012902 [Panaeolus cyanescens]|uniref:Endo-1,4-beta-xylanase n=1 Tax=Panaeolus cyanescens TaxID=181874 RepID=A0A409W2P6_9AGAR|nr:hypothetical protein CVT24_012902 [Panaeolus cyanescens]
MHIQSLLIQFTFFAAIIAVSDVVLADSPQPPISLTVSGPYSFTDNVAGCTSGPDDTVTFRWNTTTSQSYVVCGVGWQNGSNRTISYKGSYSPNGNGIYGIYGWMRDPLVEYYIVETFGYLNPSAAASRRGNTTCNGFVYDVYEATRYNQPAIDGYPQTFKQNWSVKRNRKLGQLEGTVDMDCHFKAWGSVGMQLGASHGYQLVFADGYFNSGNAVMTITS